MKPLPFLFISLFVAGTSYSQTESSRTEINSEITVSAEATVSAEPDIAEFHLAIVSRQQLATDAFKHYASTYGALQSSLGELIDSKELKTGKLSITPSFNEKNPDQTTPIYYQVSALMTLSVPLSQLNKLLAQITSVEGVTINGIEFRAKNQDSLQTAALEDAVKKAHEKAQAIAKLENLRDLKVKTMTTSISRPPVPFYGARMESIAAAPSLNASDVTVSASITVTYSAR
ncbi:MAG TPA: SIMPL domain-containing protein [Candidatus Acidoferrales bacterium]|nr:SIMPL domain-containing protein [Candidatus Acidoferrales bacterium]